jgi:hypothetical protein
MGYGNYRDYSLSPLRGLAQAKHNMGRNLSQQAWNENAKYIKDMNSGQPGMLPNRAHEMEMVLAKWSPKEIAANNAHVASDQAWQTAMAQEATAVQDRQMDLPENKLMMDSADRRHAAELQHDATKYAADAGRIPNFNGMGNNVNPLQGLAPNINLFDANGNRIGGSYSSSSRSYS